METLFDAVIIGGGLSGLKTAADLTQAGLNVKVLEARDRLGGRILSQSADGNPVAIGEHAAYDLGPAWFWPGQSRMRQFVDTYGLAVFSQQAHGDTMLEFGDSVVPQRRPGHGIHGSSYRLQGGMVQMIHALAARLPADALSLASPVTRIESVDGLSLVHTANGTRLSARCVVLALPPRLIAQILFSPALPTETRRFLESVPTWMAGHAKVVALYDRPFWREAGLSGDAMSQRGPLMQIHDASPAGDGPAALFGFVGVPPKIRRAATRDDMTSAIGAQLTRLFGAPAGQPIKLLFADWALQQATATKADQAPLNHHPVYGYPGNKVTAWAGQLIFSGTEAGSSQGGYLEGALEAADTATRLVKQAHTPTGRDRLEDNCLI